MLRKQCLEDKTVSIEKIKVNFLCQNTTMKNDNDKVANKQFATMQTLQCNGKQSSFTSWDEAKAMETRKYSVQ